MWNHIAGGEDTFTGSKVEFGDASGHVFQCNFIVFVLIHLILPADDNLHVLILHWLVGQHLQVVVQSCIVGGS